MKPQIKEKIKIVQPAVFDRETIFNYQQWSKIICLTITGLFFVFSTFACQPNPTILNSGAKTPATDANTAERPKDTFESALRGVQKSGFDYIFVIRRKDGGQFDRDDKVFIRENSPAETNQFVLTDEDRVIIAGSNYPFPEEILSFLRERLNVEDLSPKKAENANADSNNESNTTNGNSNN